MPQRIQMIHGVPYVYEDSATWDKEKKNAKHARHYIGKMVDGVFVPNKTYELECALKESKEKKPGPQENTQSIRQFCGATYLFDRIGEKLGITEDLAKCFPDIYKQLLSIAYYLILEDNNPLRRFPRWAATHSHPYGKNIPSQRSSELFRMITEDAKQRFFLLQARRRLEREYLAYDTTSISSYSELISQVRYGKNKDHEPLPQINLALLYGESSRLPVYYRKLAGNISDVTTIKRLLRDLSFLEIEKVKLILDRGFYSEENVNALYANHYKFLMGVKKSLKLVQEVFDEVRTSMHSRVHYSSEYGIYFYERAIEWKYKAIKPRSQSLETGSRRMYLQLYFDDQKAVDDRLAFNRLLDSLEEEVKMGRRIPEHETLYQKYYDISATPVRGVVMTPREEAIEAVEKNYGYFALISNDIKDPLEALALYRSRDISEKAFNNLKERLSMRRTSVSSEENLEGKLFVAFLGLIYLSYIDKSMHDAKLYKTYTLHDVLDELDIIECYAHPGHRLRVGEITNKQKFLYEALGVESPSLV